MPSSHRGLTTAMQSYAVVNIVYLQRIHNSAARLILRRPRSDSARPLLQELHWLPVACRVDFKIQVLTYKAMRDEAPVYLCELATTPGSYVFIVYVKGRVVLPPPLAHTLCRIYARGRVVLPSPLAYTLCRIYARGRVVLLPPLAHTLCRIYARGRVVLLPPLAHTLCRIYARGRVVLPPPLAHTLCRIYAIG